MFTDAFDLFVEDFLGEKLDRTLVIVGASKVDELLFRILLKFLVPPINPKDDDLLEGDSPISSFSSRIKLAHRLGILDKELMQIIDQVRKIRNLCAHRVEFDLAKVPGRDHLSNIKRTLTKRSSFVLSKKRYFNDELKSSTQELQCMIIAICVVLAAIHEKITKTEGIKEALSISIK
jgi:hypothetical protein